MLLFTPNRSVQRTFLKVVSNSLARTLSVQSGELIEVLKILFIDLGTYLTVLVI